jgi:hypothetical protein
MHASLQALTVRTTMTRFLSIMTISAALSMTANL